MKLFPGFIASAVLAGLLHTALFLSPWGDALELRFLDLWFHVRGSTEPPDEVVIVALDEDSYGALDLSPNLPWPRAAHAALLDRLAGFGPRRVVFDILFLGEGTDAAVDDQLASAMRQMPTIIGADLADVEEGGYRKKALLMPWGKFRESASVALVGLPDDDGRVRRFLLPETMSGRELTEGIPSLAAAAAGSFLSPGARDLIRFYGPRRTIPTYSFYQVLESEVPLPPETFRDKIVFVGLSMRTELGPAQKDAYGTPYPQLGQMFGVEVHATAAANLLHNEWIRRGSAAKEAVALALISTILALGTFLLRPKAGALLILACAAVWTVVAYAAFLRGAFIPGAVLVVIILPGSYVVATLINYLIVRLKEARLERAFRLYLSPSMAREVARNPEALQLGGQEIECTAMFTDIAGFTTVAEKMKPGEVGRMLNAYFTEVMDSVFDKRGTVIQFMGDGVYALWGAPVKTKDHARLCCEAALATQDAIERFNQSGRFPPLRTRLGINTGPVLVGNLGSTRRFDFTGIGDAINLASRVEGLNKYFGTTMLITDTTRAQLPVEFASMKVGLIRAVGKTRPVGLHTVFRLPVSATVATQWDDACARFVARDWQTAGEMFEAIAREEPRLTKAAHLYHAQIEAHRLNPPPDAWQGEIIFTSK